MKRNNILVAVLFALMAFFPVVYICWKVFAVDCVLILHHANPYAAAFALLIAAICIALLCFKEKQIGKVSKVLLSISVVLLPISRFLLMLMMNGETNLLDLWKEICYLALLVLLTVTAFFYLGYPWLKIMTMTVYFWVLLVVGFFVLTFAAFGEQDVRYIADIPSPDGNYSVRVCEYIYPDGGNHKYKEVDVYKSAESLRIGYFDLLKDWNYIGRYGEDDFPLDERTEIVWLSDDKFSVKDRSYYYSGEPVTEPWLPPL